MLLFFCLMIRRPPRSTRTDTLFPYTTLFRSLRRWQAARLRDSFAHFLADPSRRPAAEFFLDDVYGDRDFTRRDADIARVLPMMQRLLPEKLLGTVADAIELGALTQALDLPMAPAPQALRSDDGRDGKECVSTGSTRWLRYHDNKKQQ